MKLVYGKFETYEDILYVQYSCKITGEIVELKVDYKQLEKLIQVDSVLDIKVLYKGEWKILSHTEEDYYRNTHAIVKIVDKIKEE